MSVRCTALLGCRDVPTDAVEEYCLYLGEALKEHGLDLQFVRVDFAQRGWSSALDELRRQAEDWRGEWVLVQYTALAWSKHGFPLKFGRVLKVLQNAGARVAVVFHDVTPYGGQRIIDAIRRRTQVHAMRDAHRQADVSIFTVALERIPWIPPQTSSVVFIPVGANLPVSTGIHTALESSGEKPLTITVFGITGGEAGRHESGVITGALRYAARRVGHLRLRAFGRHADDAERYLREGLLETDVELQVAGVLCGEEAVRNLTSSDVSLFVRGGISSRRGSAIASIACGLPVVAFTGPETAFPISEAGVVLVSPQKQEELGEALVRVLNNREYRSSLAERSRRAFEKYFSWKAIAAKYAEALKKSRAPDPDVVQEKAPFALWFQG
jgi:glycosyltransferase involved in cell wall biosynthesis